MNAVLTWARLDLRRRWLSLLVLVLLVALSGGAILSTIAGARRSDTTLARLNARIAPADAMVLPNDPKFDWSKVRSLPSVERLGTFVLTEVTPQVVGADFDPDETGGFPAGDIIQNTAIDRPTMLSGRDADPHNPDEIVASPSFIAKYGRTITLRFPSKTQVRSLKPGQKFPDGTVFDGLEAHLHVVGTGINTFDLGPGGGPVYMPTYAYFTKYIEPISPYFKNARVVLHGGVAAIPEFQKELAAATGNPNIQVDNAFRENKPLHDGSTFTAVGWLLFALIAFLASIVLVGQSFIRFCASSSDDLRTLSALGLDPGQVRRAAAVGPAIATIAGAVLAIAVAFSLSTFFPTGIVGLYEPEPGFDFDPLVLGFGGFALAVVGLVGVWWSARTAITIAAEPHDRPSIIASTTRRLGLGVTAVLGARFALEPGRGKTRVPVRPALVGAVAGVLGVVGALTFRDGLDSTVSDSARFGQTFDYIGFVSEHGPQPSFAPAVAKFAKDPDLAVLDDMRVAALSVNGRATSTTSITPLVGTIPITTLSGNPPTTADQISIGPQTAKDLHVGVGSHVTVVDRQMTVSGITFVPENPHNNYTDGAWLTTAGFNAVQPNLNKDKFHEIRFSFKPGVNGAQAVKKLPLAAAPGGAGPSEQIFQPAQQVELSTVRVQPLLLGGFLVLLAIGAVGHGLATAVRRRRHDVAVLRSLGLTRLQTRMIVVTQATVVALVGLTLGIPLGIAAGRTGWRVLAHATPVLYVAPLALIGLALAIPATVSTANLLAALPARRAARLRVSQILRAE